MISSQSIKNKAKDVGHAVLFAAKWHLGSDLLPKAEDAVLTTVCTLAGMSMSVLLVSGQLVKSAVSVGRLGVSVAAIGFKVVGAAAREAVSK